MIQVDNKRMLDALVHHDEGELALVTDEEQIYQYNNGWQPYIPENDELGLTVYEINQQVIKQMPNLDADQIQNGINIIDQYTRANSYYMLLCRDMNYYTVFVTGNDDYEETVGQAAIECFDTLGAELKAIDLTDDGSAIEIWFVLPIGDQSQAICAYIFNYNEGVILCK